MAPVLIDVPTCSCAPTVSRQICNTLVDNTLATLIQRKWNTTGARIYNLLRKGDQLEDKRIAEACMISRDEVRRCFQLSKLRIRKAEAAVRFPSERSVRAQGSWSASQGFSSHSHRRSAAALSPRLGRR